jgi:hypothetical protein
MAVRTALLLFQVESQPLLRALKGWLTQSCRLRVIDYELPAAPSDPQVYPRWVAETFSNTASWIEEQAEQCGGPNALREIAIYTQAYDRAAEDWDDIRPLAASDGAPQMALVWMLVLAFPEVHWVFQSGYRHPDVERFPDVHILDVTGEMTSLRTLHLSGFTALFDPAGLRELMRRNLREELAEARAACDYLPVRHAEAVVLDEEPDYAYFMAYLPYRSGFRSWAISSLALMRWRLSDPSPVAIAIEDIYLSFPDRALDDGLSNLEDRHRCYVGLAHAQHRVVVTVGDRSISRPTPEWRANIRYLRQAARSFRVLYKPITGVFETCEKAAIRKELVWPPPINVRGSDPHDHSAPGRLFAVAQLLVARSRKLLAAATSVRDAIHAAVLAIDAKELLGGRTPTVAFEAIALQQEAEVVAESLFVGVQHNLDVKRRLQDIAEEVEYVSLWVDRRYRKRSALNARLAIVEQLARRYRDLGQIEEEIACLGEARRLRVDFWVAEKPYRWLAWPLLRYFAFALASLGRFVGVVVAWILFFGLSYYLIGLAAGKAPLSLADAMLSATRAFVTADVADRWKYLLESGGLSGREMFWKAWLTFQGVVSFTNLGLLISHLYMIAARR